MPDFFLDENLPQLQRQESPFSKQQSEASASSGGGAGNVEQIFEKIKTLFTPDLLKKMNSVYGFDLEGSINFFFSFND
jgi:hypothetical protein